MKKVWIAAFAVAAPLLAQTPAPANVAGVWDIGGEVAGVQVVEHCTFVQADDASITGSCDVQGAKWPTTGNVKGGDVTFQHNGKYNGDDYTITYHGKLDKGALTGTMDVDPFGVTGSFTAAKGTATPAPAPAGM
ncbi:hypothetical protein [Terriglobus roseus]|uniref:DUF2147 domain-containing protein n=1 Tax=Terriglobus roseus TaxID=392734 RepID=A0A1G7FAA1_9BACT|nr:hypothetical protein [Terriglobus roseus]SDE72827.1 hypothetical protein SAMN05444167_0271 [Terriglobus roseus]